MNNPIDDFTEWKKKIRALHIEFYQKYESLHIPTPYNQDVLAVIRPDTIYCKKCGNYTLRLMAINNRDLQQKKRIIGASMTYHICKFIDYVCSYCDEEIYHHPLPSNY